ncbi:MAG: hypothetical protein WCF67_24970, partial [Chitinophagaceae bacterium]
EPITILGTVTTTSYWLQEFQKDGTVTGLLEGKFVKDKFAGTWYSTSSATDLSFDFTEKDTVLNGIDTAFAAMDIAGKYFFKEGNDREGGMNVRLLNSNLLSFDISSVTGPPSYNVANVAADSLTILGNKIIYKSPELETCKFSIKFYKDFAVIDYIDNQFNCCFGLNASIDGIFLKIKP